MKLSEKFMSLQGEGLFMGMPSVFLRASHCNLRCDGQWKCDTWALLSKGDEISLDEITAWLIFEGHYHKILKGQAHLVLTGGEPFHLESSHAFTELVKGLKKPGKCFTEVETNGTLMYAPLFDIVDHITCSPKLVGSGMPLDARFKVSVLHKIMEHKSYCFKFVISDEVDMEEAQTYIKKVGIPTNKVFLMPAAGDRAALLEKMPYVWYCCEKYGYRLSTRMHLTAFDRKTGI